MDVDRFAAELPGVFDDEPRAETLFEPPGEAGDYPQWWDGVAVLGWRGIA